MNRLKPTYLRGVCRIIAILKDDVLDNASLFLETRIFTDVCFILQLEISSSSC